MGHTMRAFATIKYYNPANADPALLAGLARVVITHSQMDEVMRLTIKDLAGISITDPGYDRLVKGGAKDLRQKIAKKAKERFPDIPELHHKFAGILAKAEDVTEQRNVLVHGIWTHSADDSQDQGPHIRDKGLRYPIPTLEPIESWERAMKSVIVALNTLRNAIRTAQAT